MSTNEPKKEVKNVPKTGPKEPKEKSNSSNKWVAFLITTLLFMGAAGFLFYDNMKVKEANDRQKVQIDSISLLKNDLERKLNEAKRDLLAQLGENKVKDSIINVQVAQIDEQVNQIRGLKSNRAALQKLKIQNAGLETTINAYKFTIDSLTQRINYLAANLQQKDSTIAGIQSKLSELEAANGDLNKKVEIGAQLRVENASLSPQKKGSKGKVEIAKTIKKANVLLVSFDVAENKIAQAGEKTFYVRISDPKGKLIENSESGTFQNADQNLSFPYTKMTSVSYNNAAQKVEMPVEIPVKQLLPGNYNMEFYCDGNMCGVRKVMIK